MGVDLIKCVACGRWMAPKEVEKLERGGLKFYVCIAYKLCPWRSNQTGD